MGIHPHIVVTAPADGRRPTACGAENTERDISLRDARNAGDRALTAWRICIACRERALL